jgi:hypothetical protein
MQLSIFMSNDDCCSWLFLAISHFVILLQMMLKPGGRISVLYHDKEWCFFFLSVAVQLSYYCSRALLGSLITQNTARREYNQVLPCYVAASGLLCFIWWWCVPCLLVLTDTTSKPWASLLLLCIGYWWPCVPFVGATMFLLCLNPLLKLAVCCYASWLVCKLLDNSINCFIYHSAAVSW